MSINVKCIDLHYYVVVNITTIHFHYHVVTILGSNVHFNCSAVHYSVFIVHIIVFNIAISDMVYQLKLNTKDGLDI